MLSITGFSLCLPLKPNSINAQMMSPNLGAMKVHYLSLQNVSTLQKCWGLTQVPCGPQTWWDVGGHSRVPPGGRVTSYLLCPTVSPHCMVTSGHSKSISFWKSGDLAHFLLTPHSLASHGLHTSHLLASQHFLSQKAWCQCQTLSIIPYWLTRSKGLVPVLGPGLG